MLFLILGVVIIALMVAFAVFFLHISIYKDTIGRKESDFRQRMEVEYPDIMPWFDALRAENKVVDRRITNHKGQRLHAYFMPCQEACGTVILVHGYTGCAIQTLPHAKMYLEKMRFNVVMVDLAHHAASDGKVTGMGWTDRLDVLQWVDEVKRYFGDDTHSVVLHGLSMGGACVLMCAGEGLPPCVKAIVDDSGYSSAFAVFAHEMRMKMHLPAFPLLYAASALCKVKEGWSFGEASSVKNLSSVDTPLLIIHGDADLRVPLEEGERIKAAKKTNVEMWVVEGGTHINAIKQQPDQYAETVSLFLKRTNATEG